ncbi:type 1 fimbrial protein [Salmonella enterica]|nr:type 1 fimbrial protein [Salmonella enterica]ECN9266470.1 type 1 fimbrial protein [Salmonella enterica subsp. enterica serovar Typhimurium]
MHQQPVRLNLSRRSRSLIPDLKTLSRYKGRALVSHRIIILKEQEKMFRLFLMIIITPLFSFFASASSSDNQGSGDMHFYGSVVNAPCSIEAQSLHQSVMMDQVRAADFPSRGSWSAPKSFWIKLDNCNNALFQFASVAFTGSVDANDPQVFKVGFGADSAKGMGIGIFDSKGDLIIPDSAPLSQYPVLDGKSVLYFTAKYRSVSEKVVAGDASAAVNFSVIYQ